MDVAHDFFPDFFARLPGGRFSPIFVFAVHPNIPQTAIDARPPSRSRLSIFNSPGAREPHPPSSPPPASIIAVLATRSAKSRSGSRRGSPPPATWLGPGLRASREILLLHGPEPNRPRAKVSTIEPGAPFRQWPTKPGPCSASAPRHLQEPQPLPPPLPPFPAGRVRVGHAVWPRSRLSAERGQLPVNGGFPPVCGGQGLVSTRVSRPAAGPSPPIWLANSETCE